jgi:hypothetical protein
MIQVSDNFKTAIDGNDRLFRCEVQVFFDGDDQPPAVFTQDEVTKIQTLEEVKAEGSSPLGLVSSGEITVGFDNSSRAFTPTNPASSYYGKLRPNTLVKARLGIEVTSGVFEYVPLGEYRTGDWTAPSDDVEATVTCQDRLSDIGEKNIPMMPVQRNTTIYGMFESLFQALGMAPDEYSIDTSLQQKIKLGWLPKGKVQTALQTLATAGNCSVTADRYGRIRVQSNFAPGDPVAILDEGSQLINVDNPLQYQDTYSAVRVNYSIPVVQEPSSVLKVDNLTIPHGGTTLRDLEFSDPVYSVDQVRLLGAQNSRVTGLEFGTTGINIEIVNPGPDERVIIEAIGRIIKTTILSYTVRDKQAVAQVGDKELTIDNYLIQDQVTARRYAASLLNLLKNLLSKYTATIRGNPALEAGDVVELVSEATKLGTASVMLSRISMTYDGGLEADIDCTAQMVPVDWVFVSPGLSALAPRRL